MMTLTLTLMTMTIDPVMTVIIVWLLVLLLTHWPLTLYCVCIDIDYCYWYCCVDIVDVTSQYCVTWPANVANDQWPMTHDDDQPTSIDPCDQCQPMPAVTNANDVTTDPAVLSIGQPLMTQWQWPIGRIVSLMTNANDDQRWPANGGNDDQPAQWPAMAMTWQWRPMTKPILTSQPNQWPNLIIINQWHYCVYCVDPLCWPWPSIIGIVNRYDQCIVIVMTPMLADCYDWRVVLIVLLLCQPSIDDPLCDQ